MKLMFLAHPSQYRNVLGINFIVNQRAIYIVSDGC